MRGTESDHSNMAKKVYILQRRRKLLNCKEKKNFSFANLQRKINCTANFFTAPSVMKI